MTISISDGRLAAPVYGNRESVLNDCESFWSFYRLCIGAPSAKGSGGIPDFLVISPGKTGTTWLAKHLSAHPDVFVPPEKEIRYFDALWRYQNVDWYLNKFRAAGARMKGEASPTYAWLPGGAIKIIHELNPRLKLIVLARRQPERVWSHTRHFFRHHEATFRDRPGDAPAPSSDEIIRDFLSDLSLSASDYSGLIKRWMRYFPPSQFHVEYFENAMSSPEQYLEGLFRFLGVREPSGLDGQGLREKVNLGISLSLPEWAEALLADIYAERHTEVEEFLGTAFKLKSPWRPLSRSSASRPVWLDKLTNGWRTYFHGGHFYGWEDAQNVNPEDLHSVLKHGQTDRIIRSAFRGDLLNEIAFRSTHPGATVSAQKLEDMRCGRMLLDLQDSSFGLLVGSYRGFNHVCYLGRSYGIRQSVQGVVVSEGEDRLRQKYDAEDLIIGDSREEIESRIDAIEADRMVRAFVSQRIGTGRSDLQPNP